MMNEKKENFVSDTELLEILKAVDAKDFKLVEQKIIKIAENNQKFKSDTEIRETLECLFIQAISKAPCEVVRLFIETAGFDVNQLLIMGDLEEYPIMLALMKDKPEILKLLIEKGANVNCKDKSGNTPLTVSIAMKLTEMTRLLLANNVDVNLEGHGGVTPLHQSIFYKEIEIAKQLIEKKADIHKITPEIGPPLVAAITRKEIGIIKLLVEKGADIHQNFTIKGKNSTPLELAMNQNDPEVLNQLFTSQFIYKHQQAFRQAKTGVFGFFRRTFVNYQDLTLDKILEHAQKANNRSRQICVGLGWMDIKGKLNTTLAPQTVKDAWEQLEHKTSLTKK